MRHRSNGSLQRNGSADALATGLGWFSIALGAAELIAPRSLGRALGMEHQATLLQAYGLREIGTGIGILAAGNPAPWIWGRVAGDALDMATLAPGLGVENPKRGNVALALASVAAITLLDLYCGQQLGTEEEAARPPMPMRDYSNRSGFPKPPDEMRGAARADQAKSATATSPAKAPAPQVASAPPATGMPAKATEGVS